MAKNPRTLAHRVLAYCLLALACLPFRAAFAQDYDVEVLVYAALHADPGEERWPAPATLPDTERALRPGEAGTRSLGSAEGSLQAIAEAMRRSSQYRPLLHWRWRQPGAARGQTQPIHLQIPAGTRTPLTEIAPNASKQAMQRLKSNLELGVQGPPDQPLLDGTVTLTVTRFLHLAADLLYIDPDTGLPLQLKESRRMRLNELHYLDHPRFGVLARVSRAGS